MPSTEIVVLLGGIVVAALLIWLLSLIASAVTNGYAQDSAESDNQAGAAANLQQHPQHQNAISTITDAIHTYRRTRHSHEQQSGKREKITIAILGATAIFALIAAIGGLGSAWIFGQQLEEMRSEQRPWVNFADFKFTTVRQERDTHLFSISLTAKNSGKSPALAVWMAEPRLFLLKSDAIKENVTAIKEKCINTEQRGQLLSVGDGTIPQEFENLIVTDADFKGSKATASKLILMLCLDYRFPSNFDKRHLTGGAFLLDLYSLPDDPKDVAPEKWRVYPDREAWFAE